VSATGDYAVHLKDPDKLVEWESIEQVVSVVILSHRGAMFDVFDPFRGFFVMKFHPVLFVSILQEQVCIVYVFCCCFGGE
jgi:hypothetical protein